MLRGPGLGGHIFSKRLLGLVGGGFVALFLADPASGEIITGVPGDPFADTKIVTDILQVAPQAGKPVDRSIERLTVAVSRFRSKNYDGALESFREAKSERADLAIPELMLARLFLADGQIPSGRLALERAALVNPDDPELGLVFGDLALHEGRITDAALHFERIQRLAEDHPLTPKQERQVQVGLVSVAERRGQWDLAEKRAKVWLELDAESPEAHQRLARIQFEQNRDEEALAALTKARALQPELEPPALTLGRWHQGAGRPTQAAAWMAEVESVSADDPKTLAAIAVWRLEVDQPDEARKLVDRVAKRQPDFPGLLGLQGLVARYQRDWPTAEAAFQQLVSDNPADFGASNQLALVLIEQDDEAKRRKAAQLAEMNARQYPKSAEALATLGWIAYRVGQLDNAERLLRQAASGGQVSSEAAYFLAQVLIARGQPDEAKNLLAVAVKAPGGFAYRAESRRWLAEQGRTGGASAAKSR